MSSIIQKVVMIRFTDLNGKKVVNLNIDKIHDISITIINGETTYWITSIHTSYQLCVAEYERILKQYCYISEGKSSNINIEIGE